MTRKDYIIIAEVLRVSLNNAENSLQSERKNTPNYDHCGGAVVAIRRVSSELADALKRDNPRFNREHFLAVVEREKELLSRPSRNTVQL